MCVVSRKYDGEVKVHDSSEHRAEDINCGGLETTLVLEVLAF